MALASVEMGFWLIGMQCMNVPRLASEHDVPTLLNGWMQQIVFKLPLNTLLERSTFKFVACWLLVCRVVVGSKSVGTTSTGWDANPKLARSCVAVFTSEFGCTALFITLFNGWQQ